MTRRNPGNPQTALYIDGVLQSGTPCSTAKNTGAFGNLPLYGFARAGAQEFAIGMLDEVLVYERGLTPTEIAQLSRQP